MMLTLIDPKAGTHFPGKIYVTQHASDRAIEHFKVPRGTASDFIVERLKKAALIDARFTGDNGKLVRLFTYEGIAFIVDISEATVITLYPEKIQRQDVLTKAVGTAVSRVIKSVKKMESTELKRLNRRRADVNLELASVEHAIAHGAGKTAIRKLTQQAAELRAELERIDNEIMTVKRAKASVLKNVCAYVM